jgi:hypothetical protein
MGEITSLSRLEAHVNRFLVVWWKGGDQSVVAVEAESAAAAWEKFKALKLGGGIPVTAALAPHPDYPQAVTDVRNGKGKILAVLVTA